MFTLEVKSTSQEQLDLLKNDLDTSIVFSTVGFE